MNHHLELFQFCFETFVRQTWCEEQSKLHEAIRYCLLGGGKRVRAIMSMMVADSYGANSRVALSSAVALEMVHAYSLAHDDLPCMDNDDWRRGRPSLHRAFDESTALLAGDALLTDAFRVISDESFFSDSGFVSEKDRLQLIVELSRAAGSLGMAYGQDMDISYTGNNLISKDILDRIHKAKTGALMGAACAMGAISAGATKSDIMNWRNIGELIGLAFQAIDDTLDECAHTGKSVGKDLAQGKLTYRSFFTSGEIRAQAIKYTETAASLIPMQTSSDEFLHFVQALVFRKK